MKKGIFITVGVFLAVILGVFLLMPRPREDTKTEVGATPSPTATTESGSIREGVKEIQIVGNEYTFTPSSISVGKGEKVALTFRNTGRLPHNLTIKELGIATKTIGQGESDTVEFTASEVGILTFYCSVGNHRSLGMEGSLEVK